MQLESYEVIQSHGTQGSRTKLAPSPVRILNEWFPVPGAWVQYLYWVINQKNLFVPQRPSLAPPGWMMTGDSRGSTLSRQHLGTHLCMSQILVDEGLANLLPISQDTLAWFQDAARHTCPYQEETAEWLLPGKGGTCWRGHLWCCVPRILQPLVALACIYLVQVRNDRKWIHFAHCTSLPQPPSVFSFFSQSHFHPLLHFPSNSIRFLALSCKWNN